MTYVCAGCDNLFIDGAIVPRFVRDIDSYGYACETEEGNQIDHDRQKSVEEIRKDAAKGLCPICTLANVNRALQGRDVLSAVFDPGITNGRQP